MTSFEEQMEKDRAEALLAVRRLMLAQWGVSTVGVSDEHVLQMVRERVKQFVETVGPILDTLREAGILDAVGVDG